jgi:hypothetical protein
MCPNFDHYIYFSPYSQLFNQNNSTGSKFFLMLITRKIIGNEDASHPIGNEDASHPLPISKSIFHTKILTFFNSKNLKYTVKKYFTYLNSKINKKFDSIR